MAVHVFFLIFSLYLCTQARLREPECRCGGATFVGKTLALAIIQDVPKLAGRKNSSSNNGSAYWYSGRFPVFLVKVSCKYLEHQTGIRPRFVSIRVLAGIVLFGGTAH